MEQDNKKESESLKEVFDEKVKAYVALAVYVGFLLLVLSAVLGLGVRIFRIFSGV